MVNITKRRREEGSEIEGDTREPDSRDSIREMNYLLEIKGSKEVMMI